MNKKYQLKILVVLLLLNVGSNAFAEQEVKKLTATARKPAIILPNQPLQYDFQFDKGSDLKAWLRDNGDLYVAGYIRHNHFRCGVYQLGVQFGSGDGCVNVKWYSEPIYVSRHRQCNQAIYHHDGYDNDPKLADKFDHITCAQLTIKCEGTCGVADIPMGGGQPSGADGLQSGPFK